MLTVTALEIHIRMDVTRVGNIRKGGGMHATNLQSAAVCDVMRVLSSIRVCNSFSFFGPCWHDVEKFDFIYSVATTRVLLSRSSNRERVEVALFRISERPAPNPDSGLSKESLTNPHISSQEGVWRVGAEEKREFQDPRHRFMEMCVWWTWWLWYMDIDIISLLAHRRPPIMWHVLEDLRFRVTVVSGKRQGRWHNVKVKAQVKDDWLNSASFAYPLCTSTPLMPQLKFGLDHDSSKQCEASGPDACMRMQEYAELMQQVGGSILWPLRSCRLDSTPLFIVTLSTAYRWKMCSPTSKSMQSSSSIWPALSRFVLYPNPFNPISCASDSSAPIGKISTT